jgi:FkbM family methyltransferase
MSNLTAVLLSNDLNEEEKDNLIFEYISTKEDSLSKVIVSMEATSTILSADEKAGLYNRLGLACYNKNLYNFVMPFFEKSLEYKKDNADVLFNIAFVAHALGEDDLSISYLNQIASSDPAIINAGREIYAKITAKKDAIQQGFIISYVNESVEILNSTNNQKLIIPYKNLVYTWEMMNNFNEYFNYVESKLIDGINTVDYSLPAIHTLKKSKVPFYFSSIAEDESPLIGYTKLYTPKEGDIVFDCGAYCGVTAYLFSKLVGPTGKVYAFEPDENNYNALIKNIEMHNLTNVIPVKKGVYGTTQQISFNSEGCLGGAISTLVPRVYMQDTVIIDVVSLEDAFKEFGLDHVDLIKMDIEGAEVDTILGTLDFIRDKKLKFTIASYHVLGSGQAYTQLEKLFPLAGYQCLTGNQGHLTTWAWN